jgi:hypothetical protein
LAVVLIVLFTTFAINRKKWKGPES